MTSLIEIWEFFAQHFVVILGSFTLANVVITLLLVWAVTSKRRSLRRRNDFSSFNMLAGIFMDTVYRFYVLIAKVYFTLVILGGIFKLFN